MCLDVDRYPPSFFITWCVRGNNKMKTSTENEIAGKVHEVEGTIKEKVGELRTIPTWKAKALAKK